MNKMLWKKIVSVFVIAAMLLGSTPAKTEAAKKNSVTEQYCNGVFERFDTYLASDYSYLPLTMSDYYAYSEWAEEMKEMGAIKKTFVFATNYLTDRKLTKKEYTEYLSELMTMMEKGFISAAAARTNYEAKKLGLDDGLEFTAKVCTEFLDLGVLEGVETAMEHYGMVEKVEDLIDIQSEMITSANQALALMLYSDVFEKKVAFLEAIRDNTDVKPLKKAADAMLGAANAQMYCFMTEYLKDAADTLAEFVWDYDNPSGDKLFVGITKSVFNTLDFCLKKLNSKWTLFASEGVIATKAAILAEGACYVAVGFEIGGKIGEFFAGEKLDSYRRAFAMNEISSALSSGMMAKFADTRNGSTTARYNAIVKFTACAEALLYSRYLGEIAIVNTLRGKKTVSDEMLDKYLNRKEQSLSLCYNELAKIFPEPPAQVVVSSNFAEVQEENFYEICAQPVITVVGNEEATKKIAESETMKSFYSEVDKWRKYVKGCEHTGNYDYFVLAYISDILSVRGAMSMQFIINCYTGGAHPNSYKFSVIYSLTTGEELTFNDLFDSDDALTQFTALYQKYGKEQYGSGELRNFDWKKSIQGFISSGAIDNRFGFTEKGITITYSPEEIASRGMGYITPTIPYSALEGVLSANYLPITTYETNGSLEYHTSAELYENHDLTTNNNLKVYGDSAVHGAYAVGTVYNCKWHLRENGWTKSSNSYSVDNYISYYFNYMTENDLVWFKDYDNENHPAVTYQYCPGNSTTLKKKSCYITTKNGNISWEERE